MNDLNRRIEALERIIKTAGEAALWIDGLNNVIRVDIARRRGQPVTFQNPYEARCWLEKMIGQHAGGFINYSVDNVCDLAEDAEGLKAAVREIIPGKIVIPQTSGRQIGGQVQPLVFDADQLPGTLAMRNIPAGMPADLRLWCLGSLLKEYFGNRVFCERWKAGELSGEDNQMFTALFIVFSWEKEGEPLDFMSEFVSLLYQVADLPPLEVEPA